MTIFRLCGSRPDPVIFILVNELLAATNRNVGVRSAASQNSCKLVQLRFISRVHGTRRSRRIGNRNSRRYFFSEYRGFPKIVHYWTSANAVRIQQEFRNAQKKDYKTDAPLSEEDMTRKLTAFLDSLEGGISSDNESEPDVFNQKWVFYQVLMGRLPEGNFKTAVIRRYLRYLNGLPMQKDSFIEWFVIVKRIASDHPKLFQALETEFYNPTFTLMVSEAKAAI